MLGYFYGKTFGLKNSLSPLDVGSWGESLHSLFSLPAPTLTTCFQRARAIFQAKHFFTYYTPTFSTAVTLHTYLPMKMDGWVGGRTDLCTAFSFPLHLQRRATSDDVTDLYQQKVELWVRNGRSDLAYSATSTGIVGVFYMPQSCDMGPTASLPLWRKTCWIFFARKIWRLIGYQTMKMEQTECSETLGFKLQTPGSNPEKSVRQIVTPK
jgi:hypothetical protein